MKRPAVLEWLIRAILPGGVRGAHILGDLREDFAVDARVMGRWAAGTRMVMRALEVRRHLGWRRRPAARDEARDEGGMMGAIVDMVRELRLSGRAQRRASRAHSVQFTNHALLKLKPAPEQGFDVSRYQNW